MTEPENPVVFHTAGGNEVFRARVHACPGPWLELWGMITSDRWVLPLKWAAGEYYLVDPPKVWRDMQGLSVGQFFDCLRRECQGV